MCVDRRSHRCERIRDAVEALGSTQEQVTLRQQSLPQPINSGGLGLLIEVDQHVATEDQVELSGER
jgi:hypothetical protein